MIYSFKGKKYRYDKNFIVYDIKGFDMFNTI